MAKEDIRLQQRFENYQKALGQLTLFIQNTTLNALEEQGLIQAFEYTHELAWKSCADFLKDRGNATIFGSKDATREAFRLGLITDGEVWMDMIQSRNMSSHTYNAATAQKIISAIRTDYHPAFMKLEKTLAALLS